MKTYFCKTREIHQGEVENVRRIDLEVDGLASDALIVAGYSSRLIFNLALDVAKVGVAPVGDVVELAPFAGTGNICVVLGGMRRLLRGVGFFVRDVDELEN